MRKNKIINKSYFPPWNQAEIWVTGVFDHALSIGIIFNTIRLWESRFLIDFSVFSFLLHILMVEALLISTWKYQIQTQRHQLALWLKFCQHKSNSNWEKSLWSKVINSCIGRYSPNSRTKSWISKVRPGMKFSTSVSFGNLESEREIFCRNCRPVHLPQQEDLMKC